MNTQQLRILIAGVLCVIALGGVVGLAVTMNEIPELLGYVTIASISYLFGVTTNGSGIGKGPKDGGAS